MMNLVLIFLIGLSWGQSNELVGSDNGAADSIRQGRTDMAAKLHNMVECMKDRGHDSSLKNDGPTRKLSRYNFDRMRYALAEELDLYGGMDEEEMSLFLSQIFHESKGFSAVNERATFGEIPGHSYFQEGVEQNAHAMIRENRRQAQMDYFKKVRYGAKHRGRGVIQLTGCSNYLSFIHYVSTGYTQWNESWIIKGDLAKNLKSTKGLMKRNGGYQVDMVCSDDVLKAMKKQYEADYPGIKFDPFGIMKDLEKSFVPGVKLKSKTGEEVTGEQLLMKTAMAFWDGKKTCNKKAKDIVASFKENTAYTPSQNERECNGFKEPALCNKIADLSRCVNGGTNGLEDRVKWYKVAQLCTGLHYL